MHYFQVAVSSSKYHGLDPLTYSFDKQLKPGSVVAVPLRSGVAAGIVLGPEI